mmetsp:Transcript_37870/g.93785  ORF Transcript_37870/g.93785 Transcript_37870/m.93785 type:complete len:246 (-) Transcript_37870:34-771(-)
MYLAPTFTALALSVKEGAFRSTFIKKTRAPQLPVGIEDLVEAQLLRHTQQVMLEACASASSARLRENLQGTPRESEASNESTQPVVGPCSFLTALDEAVSDSLDAHVRRLIEIDANEGTMSSWIFRPRGEGGQVSRAEPSIFADVPQVVNNARVLYALSEDEIRAALPVATTDKPLSSPSSSFSKKNLVLDGVCKNISRTLHYAQLRLDIYRQSLKLGGGSPLPPTRGKKKKLVLDERHEAFHML